VERRIFPRDALGFSPLPGDRVLMKGVWVLDCGHPPYGAEMHPPTFLHYARSPDARSTVAAAVVVPYRSALLFQPNVALATDFGNTQRLGDSASVPFSNALVGAVLHAMFNNDDRLATHGLMVPNRFDRLDWLVCAPLPRPAGAMMDASWRFTARTGVRVKTSRYGASGCVRFVATMDASYSPMLARLGRSGLALGPAERQRLGAARPFHRRAPGAHRSVQCSERIGAAGRPSAAGGCLSGAADPRGRGPGFSHRHRFPGRRPAFSVLRPDPRGVEVKAERLPVAKRAFAGCPPFQVGRRPAGATRASVLRPNQVAATCTVGRAIFKNPPK